MHVASEEAPVTLLKVPEGQAAALIEEGGQNEPIGQIAGMDVPGNGHSAPEGHERQVELDDAPVTLLNVPDGQTVAVFEEGGQKDPAGQSEQLSECTLVENEPAEQGTHEKSRPTKVPG